MKNNKKKSPLTTIAAVGFVIVLVFVIVARRAVNNTDSLKTSAFDSPLATPSFSELSLSVSPSPTQYKPLATQTATTDEVGTAYAVIAKDQATSTAESAKTSTAVAMENTVMAQKTDAFWVGVTFAIGTSFATQTQIKGTEIGGTEQAAYKTSVPATETAIKATQIVEADRLNSARVSIWGGVVAFFAFIGVVIFGMYKLILFGEERGKIENLKKKSEALKPDSNGRHSLITSSDLKPGEKILNPDLMHTPTLDPESKNDFDSEQQLRNTQSARNLEAIRVLAPHLGKQAGDLAQQFVPEPASNYKVEITKPENPPSTPVAPALPLSPISPLALPEWSSFVNDWNGKELSYGVGAKGLLTANSVEEPHILIVGRTRSGKSRYGLRTIAACALAMEYQVLFIGKRVDFYPFENHPNAKIVGVDLINEPKKYLNVLRRVALLMKERDDFLTDRRLSIWQQTGQPELYVILDEFSSAVRQLNAVKSGMGNLVSNIATALIQEGGKYGINIIQVVQDATGANVDITARRNMGKMVFRLSEAKASEIALGVREPSATSLPLRHFFSVIGGSANITLGAAFAPSDDDIQAFLLDRPVRQHAPMIWVDDVLPASNNQSSIVSPVVAAPSQESEVFDIEKEMSKQWLETRNNYTVLGWDEIEDKIAQAWLRMRDDHIWLGWNELERIVYNEIKNGARSVKIKKVVAELQGVEPDKVNIEIDRLIESWSTTRSATPATTHQNDDFQPILTA